MIANLNGVGIYQTAGALHVEDTTVRNNASIGIWSVGFVRANLDRVRMEENLNGVRAQDGAQVVVNDSVMTLADVVQPAGRPIALDRGRHSPVDRDG